LNGIIWGVKRRKKKKPQITQISQIFKKEIIVVTGLLLLAFILRLIYLSHLKVNDPNFYQPAPGTDMFTYHKFKIKRFQVKDSSEIKKIHHSNS
jgi:hypothetical protein